MRNNGPPIPSVEKISRLIDALRTYAVKEAVAFAEAPEEVIYQASTLALWDAILWFELARDQEVVDFLVSGSDRAKLLVMSLQNCLQWYEQNELDEINSRLQTMRIIN